MKRVYIAGIILVIVIFGFFIFATRNGSNIKNIPPKNKTILIFGDSLAEGVGATKGNDLASRLATTLKTPVLNYGKSGDTTSDALERLAVTLKEDPGVVLIILGGNDFLKKISQAETFENLEKIVTFFQDKGAVVVLVGVRSGLIGDGRGDEFSSLAQKTGSVYIPDILKGVFGKLKYMSDEIHPNDAGYAMIEKRFATILADLFEK